jgi:crotonobetainyl-CoA:carnitine CoA-transferase CaiB-like acyl-CoA transferase
MYRLDHVDELMAKLYVWAADKTKDEVLAIGRAHKVPTGVAYSPADLLEAPGLAERGFFDEVRVPGGTARMPGRPFGGLGWKPPDRLHQPGEDTDAVTADWLAATGAGR